ncbi:hypothetical protein JY651_05765 [Pyxidicoccus parkwayensis]|jgi:hypothetical protein|uniref:Lipoprotein n=1 Tax=Pyxidicoccus parkwayensis TaxID=2813578 RepID=A0ABX7P2M6_9BACT|nr:hypothetical protein [Pyxidicoccus parkwaysis]QSQ24458.1 hypothetical protein JY651_05765 [Pyxidicoccus parkwaysis]
MKKVIFASGWLLFVTACSTTQVLHPSRASADQPGVTFEASPERARYLLTAFDEIQAILADPAFAEALVAFDDQRLATSADSTCTTTRVSEVLAALKTRLPTYKYVLGSRYSLFHPFSTAGTSVCGGSWINTRRIDRWADGTPAQRGKLINTIAHELTHILASEDTDCEHSPRYAYSDRGHAACSAGSPECSDAFLVSYVWGDILECAYRLKHGVIPGTAFHACVLGLVNSNDVMRTSLVPKFQGTSSECQRIGPWAPVVRSAPSGRPVP